MGIFVVLIFYAVVLTVLAFVVAAVLGAVTYSLTKRSGPAHKRAVLVSILFPFACVICAGALFVAYAAVNYAVFSRDPMLGDSWMTPLPNGYALMMIDTTDEGTVYNPKTQGTSGLVSGGEHVTDAVFGVRQLQVSNALIFGARDTGYSNRIGQDSKFVDSYFELDTHKRTRTDFISLDALRRKASSEGVKLALREFQSVFGDYRTTWFDYLAGAALIGAPFLAFAFLASWIWKMRQMQM